MCTLLATPRYKVGQNVAALSISYLKTFHDHGNFTGKILDVLVNVHNKYIPEYKVETATGILTIPEYSIEDVVTPQKTLNVGSKSKSTAEVLLF